MGTVGDVDGLVDKSSRIPYKYSFLVDFIGTRAYEIGPLNYEDGRAFKTLVDYMFLLEVNT